MAFINLLHNGYQGKLGETVGQKWKNQRTVRTYNPHNTSKSQYQEDVRNNYKKIIGIASECYPYLFGAQYVNPKNRNKFNAFTSAMHKIYHSKQDEIIETGVFKNPTGIQLKPSLFATNAFTYLVYNSALNPQVISVTKLKAVGILVKETTSTISAPVIDTFNTKACYAKYSPVLGSFSADQGVIVQLGTKDQNITGSIIQVALTIQGKECIQRPVIIKDILSDNKARSIRLEEEKLIQTF